MAPFVTRHALGSRFARMGAHPTRSAGLHALQRTLRPDSSVHHPRQTHYHTRSLAGLGQFQEARQIANGWSLTDAVSRILLNSPRGPHDPENSGPMASKDPKGNGPKTPSRLPPPVPKAASSNRSSPPPLPGAGHAKKQAPATRPSDRTQRIDLANPAAKAEKAPAVTRENLFADLFDDSEATEVEMNAGMIQQGLSSGITPPIDVHAVPQAVQLPAMGIQRKPPALPQPSKWQQLLNDIDDYGSESRGDASSPNLSPLEHVFKRLVAFIHEHDSDFTIHSVPLKAYERNPANLPHVIQGVLAGRDESRPGATWRALVAEAMKDGTTVEAGAAETLTGGLTAIEKLARASQLRARPATPVARQQPPPLPVNPVPRGPSPAAPKEVPAPDGIVKSILKRLKLI